MSKRIIDGTQVYSLTSIVEEFLNLKSRKVVNEFILFMIKCDILTKEVVKYGNRNSYVYSPTPWFSVKFEGHYYTKTRKRGDEVVNGTLYFDEFASRVMARVFMMREHGAKEIKDRLFYVIALDTALDQIPMIGQINKKDEDIKDEERDQINKLFETDEERETRLREVLNNNIQNVIGALKEKREAKNKKINKK